MNLCEIIIPSSGTVDMYDNVPVGLTFQIADIKDPSKRHGDFSKTITVPGTANNHKMFQMIFDVGVDRYYDPNKKARAYLTVNKNTVLKGFMRLRSIKEVDGKIDYELEITGRISDLFTALGDTKVKDLPWSDLDHLWTLNNVTTSWRGTIGSNYLYPYADYGYTIDDKTFNVDHFMPWVYVKEVWDRIMMYFGYQVSSSTSFFTSSPFKNLVMSTGVDRLRLTQAQINARKLKASRASTSQTVTVSTNIYPTVGTDVIFNDDSTNPNHDTGGNYSTVTGKWTCPTAGHYKLKTILNLQKDNSVNYGTAFALIYDATQGKVLGAPTQNAILSSPNITYSISSSTPTPVYISAGSQVHVLFFALKNFGASNYDVNILPSSTFEIEADPILHEGDQITFGNIFHENLKCSDFVKWVIKMFNIYTEYDKDTANKLIMDPRNSFYGTTVIDWTQKRDLSRDLEITPMGALGAKRYLFTYKKDEDIWNEDYYKSTNEVYGQYRKDVDNDFLTETKTEEIGFSIPPLDSTASMATGSTPYGPINPTSTEDRYFYRMFSLDSSGKPIQKAGVPKLGYYNGLRQCKPWLLSTAFSASSGVTNYPYVGHLDDPITPTTDICWGMPIKVYYDPAFNATYTDSNLFNNYWKQELDEITDKNSSIVTGWFKLDATDIATLDFRNIYRFSTPTGFHNFRLNKVYDYNPTEEGFTKCEFIKLKQGVPFTGNTGILNGANNSLINGIPLPYPSPRPKKGGVSVGVGGIVSGKLIMGSNNVVPDSAERIFITGNQNVVGENCYNVAIINSSGCTVAGGVGEAVIINSSGVTVTSNNQLVINNVVQPGPNSGTYTPLAGNYSNIDSVVPTVAFWYRVGTIVTVSGRLSADATAAGPANFTLNLPIPSSIANNHDLSGIAYSFSSSLSMEIYGDIANDKAYFTYTPGGTTALEYSYQFSYRII